MKPTDASRLLPHEYFFGAYLIVMWLRLALGVGLWSGDALLYCALLGVNLAVIYGCRASPTGLRWQLRLWFYPAAMNVIYFNLKGALPRLQSDKFDTLLQHLDAALIGRNLSLRLEPIVHPALSEVLSVCYLLFFPYLLLSLVYYCRAGLPQFRALTVGLFTIYGFGFLGYTLVPASGPWVAMREQFSVPLSGWFFTDLNARVVVGGSNGVDVFPSLHCAVSCFFLFFDRRHARWRFRLYLAPCFGLWCSTIYLRYHYFIDLICGFALASFALWLARRRAAPVEPELQTPVEPCATPFVSLNR